MDEMIECEVCGTDFVANEKYGANNICPNCGAVHEWIEGQCLMLDEELKKALLVVLLKRKGR